MEFQGLQNSLPGVITVIITLLICILSWYSYKRYSSISFTWKVLLSSLRGLSLCVLLFLFLNPFFKTSKEVVIKPKIAVLLDDSESTTISKGAYEGTTTYNSTLAQLRNTPKDVELNYFKFGSSIQNLDPDNFSPAQPATNIFNAIETITTSDESYASAVLISDGIITEGKNPVILSGSSTFPIHVVAIGDTSRVKDISIQNISTNATGFTNTNHSIEVDISQYGFDNQNINLKLSSGETVINSKELNISKDREIESVQFEIELNSPGLKQYIIEIEPIAGEWTTENNLSSFSVEVLDSKKRILHLASAIHPDVKALRSILVEDQNIELSTFTYLNQSKSIKNIITTDEYDLIIFHGQPPSSVVSDFEITNSGYSSLYISLPNQSLTSPDWFNIISVDSRETYESHFMLNDKNLDHPILELPDINLNSLAPVQSSINASNDFPDAITLYTTSYQNIATDSPLISILEQGNSRRTHFNGFDWYRLYLSPNNDERAFIQELISNLVDWTSSDPDNRLLKVKPTKNEFNSSESPIINAGLINENGEIETAGTIEITLSGSNYDANFNMENLNNGNYRLQAPNLPDGKYTFNAIARKGTREIDTQSGEFLVSESNIELANTIRNQDLLKSIASNSGGLFFEFSSITQFWNNQSISNELVSKTEIQESYIFPVRSVYWFVLVLLLLGTEWLLRKKFALP